MFNIKIFCYHPYDKFPATVIGRTGKTAQELMEWAGKKIFPIIFQSPAYGKGVIDVVLFNCWGDKIAEKSFKF